MDENSGEKFHSPKEDKTQDLAFQTPAILPGPSGSNIGLTTPAEFISKKGKKRSLRTPTANEGLIKMRVANENIQKEKGTGLMTPEPEKTKKMRRPLRAKNNATDDLDISLPNIDNEDNPEVYFQQL